MKRYKLFSKFWTLSGILISMAFLCVSIAAAQVPSIEGTYQFISRTLPDGTVIKPPEIMGLSTYTKTHRNFNLVQKTATGKFYSNSSVSTYTLTATAYTETPLFSIRTDQIAGKDVVYDLSSQTRSAPVTVEGGRIQFKPGPRSNVYQGNTWTATGAEGNVDVWEKVQ